MTKARSLHIGLNRVDPDAYGGWNGALVACEADAHSMQSVASGLGYETTTLLTEHATASSVLDWIDKAAHDLRSGDICLVSNSSHGGQIPDESEDEPDGLDETWVMYDRQVIDDELYHRWRRFAPGVRVVVVSDSCHSGTVTRAMPIMGTEWQPESRELPAVRAMPPDVQRRDYQRRGAEYGALKAAARDAESKADELQCTVVLLSGCQDNQTSLDGATNGLFTEHLLRTWEGGRYPGRSYRGFVRAIRTTMPPTQSPNFLRVGAPNPGFLRSHPFSI